MAAFETLFEATAASRLADCPQLTQADIATAKILDQNLCPKGK
jgi:hypothetical protein